MFYSIPVLSISFYGQNMHIMIVQAKDCQGHADVHMRLRCRFIQESNFTFEKWIFIL